MWRRIVPVLLLAGCLPSSATHSDGGGSAPYRVTLTMTSFTVMPASERYACQDFANPFDGDDVGITEFESHLSAGAHHMLVFYKPGATNSALADCSGSEFAPGPYGSQRLDDTLSYPPGVAARIPAASGLRVQAHFLNATMSPIAATVQISMTRAPDGSVDQSAAVLFFSNRDIQIPGNATGVVAQKSCTLPFDVNLIEASSHMHQHGVSFVAQAPSAMLFQTSDWSNVTPASYSPPLFLPSGTAISFACTYDNDGPTPITYGDSALTDEMCIFSAQFYPAPFGGWSCL